MWPHRQKKYKTNGIGSKHIYKIMDEFYNMLNYKYQLQIAVLTFLIAKILSFHKAMNLAHNFTVLIS